MTSNDIQPRSAIYVNNRLFSTSQITPLALPFSDVTAITLSAVDATTVNSKPHLIINVYNPCDKSIILELHEYLQKNIDIHNYGIIIVGGDFNMHHPVWNPEGYARHDEEAELPPGTVTYPNAGTTIDLVW